MYQRYFKEECMNQFSEDNYLSCLREQTTLLPVSEEDEPVNGYIPYYIVTYIRSTGNDVIVFKDEEKQVFYNVAPLCVRDSKSFIEDEGLLSAKGFLETVLSDTALGDTELPFKSFPSARGAFILKVPTSDTEYYKACFLIMSVIIDKEYFDKLELKEGYFKCKFERSDYPNDAFTNRVADSFITVHKPKGGTV